MLRVDSLDGWKEWLEAHGGTESLVWLVFIKKGQGSKKVKVPFTYQEALDEALCYGWVDSLLKSIDEKEYMRKFTPRKPSATWSEINKKRVEWLTGLGRMQPAGLKTIEVAKENGMWDKGVTRPVVNEDLPGALLAAFAERPGARDNYFKLKSGEQKNYNIWINMARRPGTVASRVDEALEKLERGEKLGLK